MNQFQILASPEFPLLQFLSFFVLGALVAMVGRSWSIARRNILLLGLLVGLIWAAVNEVRQMSVAGRVTSGVDVGIGSLASFLGTYVALRIFPKGKSQ